MLTTEEGLLSAAQEWIIPDIIASQRQKGLRASGYSAENTRPILTRSASTVTLTITGPTYWKNQQYGRRGSSSPVRPGRAFIDIIRAWIQVKGIPIPLTAAGAVAYKILNSGIRVPNPHNPGGVLSEPLAPERITAGIAKRLAPSIKAKIYSALLSA